MTVIVLKLGMTSSAMAEMQLVFAVGLHDLRCIKTLIQTPS